MIMNVLPVSMNNNQSFQGLKVLPAARKSIADNIDYFYGGKNSLDRVYDKLEKTKISVLDYLKVRRNEKNAILGDVDIVLHNVYVNPKSGEISYLYSAPELDPGFFMHTTKDSVLKNPVEVFKQAMSHHAASLHSKFNIPWVR